MALTKDVKKKKRKSTSVKDFAEVHEELEEFWEEVKAELVRIREEMEEMRIALDRGMKKTWEEIRGILQDSLAEMTGMFTGLVEEVKDQGEKNRAQLESDLNLDEELEIVYGFLDNCI